MKKFFYRRRRQIFAVLACLVLIILTALPCFATASIVNPYEPTYENLSIYRPYGYGYSTILPIGDFSVQAVIANTDANTGYKTYEYTSVPLGNTSLRYNNTDYIGSYYSSDMLNTRVLVRSNYADSSDLWVVGRPCYRYTTTVANISADYGLSSIKLSATNFCYIPFLNEDGTGARYREIFTALLGYDDKVYDYAVRAEWSYLGNTNSYLTTYTDTTIRSSGRSLLAIDMRDIVDKSNIPENGSLDVPIIIKSLIISIGSLTDGAQYSQSLTMDIYVPVMSTQEYEWLQVNNNYIYNTTLNQKPVEFGFDWIINGVSAILSAQFFGSPYGMGVITLGGLCFTVIALLMGIAILEIIKALKP